VVNPFAHKIKLPEEAHKIRRLNQLYQAFVKQITLLHQYQRICHECSRLRQFVRYIDYMVRPSNGC
jgi:hypothetical protein